MSGRVEFALSGYGDADRVRLETGFGPGRGADFERVADGWRLSWDRPAIDRLEYQFTVRRGGSTEWITDPGNPRTVPNPFGSKSELVLPEYRPPEWLAHKLSGALGDKVDLGVAPGLSEPIPVRVWTCDDLPDDVAAPLLLVHDGSDLADRGSLLRWASSLARPLRVALLDPAPGRRDAWYSADPDYTAAVTDHVLPALCARWAISEVIALGASLGAVAVLALARAGVLAGAVMQSGSFFTADLDAQERGFPFFDRLCAFTSETVVEQAIPTVMSCGTVEENRANNERMSELLDAPLHLVRDAHTLTCWRDAWSPAVDQLLNSLGE